MFGNLNFGSLIPSLVQGLASGNPLAALTGQNPNANGAGLSVPPAQASRDLAMPLFESLGASVLPDPTGLVGKSFTAAPNRNDFAAPLLFGAPLNFAAQARNAPQAPAAKAQAPADNGAKTEFGDILLQLFGNS